MGKVTAGNSSSERSDSNAPGGRSGTVADKKDWGKLVVKQDEHRYYKDSASQFGFSNYANAAVGDNTSLDLMARAESGKSGLEVYEAVGSLEESVVLEFHPGGRFKNEKGARAVVVVTHTARVGVNSVIGGDVEKGGMNVASNAGFDLVQFGKPTKMTAKLQATGKDVEVESRTTSSLKADGSVEVNRDVSGGFKVDTDGKVSAEAGAKESAKLGGSASTETTTEQKEKFKREGAKSLNEEQRFIAIARSEQDLGHPTDIRETKSFAVTLYGTATATASGQNNLAQATVTCNGTWKFELSIQDRHGKELALLPLHDGDAYAAVGYAVALERAQLKRDVLTLFEAGAPLAVAARAVGVPDREALDELLAFEAPPAATLVNKTIDEILFPSSAAHALELANGRSYAVEATNGSRAVEPAQPRG